MLTICKFLKEILEDQADVAAVIEVENDADYVYPSTAPPLLPDCT